jgi:hypothetical protein
MKKHIEKLSMLTLCAAAIFAVPALSRAQDTTNTPPTPPAPAIATPPAPAIPPVKTHKAASSATLPFRGTLTAVDTNVMTLTVETRTFEITSGTLITKDGKPAVLAEGVVGEMVRGAYKKTAEGRLDAVTVHFGGKTEGKKKEPAAN